MAILADGDLALELRFREFDDYGWVQYDILFLWRGEPIVRDEVLKRHNDHWNARGPSVLTANEDDGDTLIPLLETVLEKNEPDYWTPTDPDVTIGFYPEMYFPLLKPHWKLIRESEQFKQEREDRERRKTAAGGKLPDDSITVMVRVDAYNFKECDAYQGSGIALTLVPTRESLERFLTDLKAEYEFFERQYGIKEWVARRDAELDRGYPRSNS